MEAVIIHHIIIKSEEWNWLNVEKGINNYPKSSLGHLSCHEVPISDHELKVTPWEHKSSFNLHSATNLLETDEQLERISPNTRSSTLVLAYFFTCSAKLHPGVHTHSSLTHWLNQQPKKMLEYDDMISIGKRTELVILFLNSFRNIYCILNRKW